MTTIKKLTQNTVVNTDDLFVIWDSTNSSTRNITASTLTELVNDSDVVSGLYDNDTQTLTLTKESGDTVEVTGFNTVSDEDLVTLSYFKYDPVDDKLEATKAIVTTLSSLYLGDQWRMQSGGNSIYYTNLSTTEELTHASSGVLDQSNPLNQNASGVIAPHIKVYDDVFKVEEFYGVVGASGVIPYEVIQIIDNDLVAYAVEFVSEEEIQATDYIFYEAYFGTDDTGTFIYEQKTTGHTIAIGDTFNFFFDHGLDLITGTSIFTVMYVADDSDGTNKHVLDVRRAQDLYLGEIVPYENAIL